MLFTFYLKQRLFDFFKSSSSARSRPQKAGSCAAGVSKRPFPVPFPVPVPTPALGRSLWRPPRLPAVPVPRSVIPLPALTGPFLSWCSTSVACPNMGLSQGSADYGHVGPPPVVVDKVTGTICVCVAPGSVPWPTKPLQPLTKSVR